MFVDRYGLDMTWEEYDGYYRMMAGTIYSEKASFYPGAHELLQEMKYRDIPMGMATSSPHYWLTIIYKRFPLREYFPSSSVPTMWKATVNPLLTFTNWRWIG